jgi:hypothetical protein
VEQVLLSRDDIPTYRNHLCVNIRYRLLGIRAWSAFSSRSSNGSKRADISFFWSKNYRLWLSALHHNADEPSNSGVSRAALFFLLSRTQRSFLFKPKNLLRYCFMFISIQFRHTKACGGRPYEATLFFDLFIPRGGAPNGHRVMLRPSYQLICLFLYLIRRALFSYFGSSFVLHNIILDLSQSLQVSNLLPHTSRGGA